MKIPCRKYTLPMEIINFFFIGNKIFKEYISLFMQDTLVLNSKLVKHSLYNISIKCHLDTDINTQRCVFYFMERYIIEPIVTKNLLHFSASFLQFEFQYFQSNFASISYFCSKYTLGYNSFFLLITIWRFSSKLIFRFF